MNFNFQGPSSENPYVKLSDLEGSLVVIEVQGFEAEQPTPFGFKPAIEAVVHDIDGQQTYRNQSLINSAIVTSLKSRVDSMVLARVVKGRAKPGQQAPWLLEDASTDPLAVEQAQAYLQK